MGMTKKFYLHGILLPSGAWISQLTDTTPAAAVEQICEYAAGAYVPSFRGGHGAVPEITFTSPQLKTVLDLCGLAGADLSAGNVDLFYRAATNLGTRAAIGDGAHIRIRAVRAMMTWDQITARQNQLATIGCRIIPTFDGTTPPLVGLGSQTIAANLLASQAYTLGPVKLNGAWIDGSIDWTLNLNPKPNDEASDGDAYISWAGVERHDPVLSVTPRDLGHWETIGVGGLQVTACLAYLRKKSADLVGNVADANAEHILFSGTDNPCGMATLEQSSDGSDGAAQIALRVGLRISDAASAHPLTLNTATAIA